jgi:F0F1-type ATP synthase assembly protein I
MAENPKNRAEVGYYAMIQIGLEMAAPVALGIWLDSLFGWLPWLTTAGAVLGLTLGLVEVSRVGGGGSKENSESLREGQLPGDKEP